MLYAASARVAGSDTSSSRSSSCWRWLIRSSSMRATVSVPSQGRGARPAFSAASLMPRAAGRRPASVTSRASSSRIVTRPYGLATGRVPPPKPVDERGEVAFDQRIVRPELRHRRRHEAGLHDGRDLREAKGVRVAGRRAGRGGASDEGEHDERCETSTDHDLGIGVSARSREIRRAGSRLGSRHSG